MSGSFYIVLLTLLSIASAGAIAYCVMAIAIIRRFARDRSAKTEAKSFPPISLLKPISGAIPGLEKNLQSFFLQDYPEFEILFAVRTERDPAVATIEQLMKQYPAIPCRLAVTGNPAYANAKVYSLEHLFQLANTGHQFVLSAHVINHHVISVGFLNSFLHRLRWNRSSRFSRPIGYFGQGFTHTLPWAVMLVLADPSASSFGVLALSLALRAWLACELGARLLNDKAVLRSLWLIPLQDGLSFASWLGGFWGKEIVWRNERYELFEDGRMTPVSPRTSGMARN